MQVLDTEYRANNMGAMSDYLDPHNEELLQDFFFEAESRVELLESSILVLESDSGNRDAYPEARIKIWAGDNDLLNVSTVANLTFDRHAIPDIYAS